MRHTWDRGDNRAGMHWEGGQRCVLGPLTLWVLLSKLKMMAVFPWKSCSFTGH